MIKPFLIVIILFIMAFNVSGQAFRNIDFYLKSKHISNTAKDFYSGKFKADDGLKTLSIVDSVTTRNDLTRPFYFYLVSKMMQNSDGALSEAIGNIIKLHLEKHPDQVIDFLYSNNPLVTKQCKSDWATTIAAEFVIICEDKVKQCIASSLKTATDKASTENKSRLNHFYKLIRSY